MNRQIKICCIQDRREARLALDAGADYLGLVSAMPSGPGPISEDRIREVLDSLPDRDAGVLLTSLEEPADIIEQARRLDARALQLCSHSTVEQVRELRAALPGVRLIPVVHVTGSEVEDDAVALAEVADAVLLDTGMPNADVPVLGGTGLTHDWSVSKRIVERAKAAVFLAGGLTPANLAEAMATVRPQGIDVCSGVRSAAGLDRDKVEAFVSAVRAADG